MRAKYQERGTWTWLKDNEFLETYPYRRNPSLYVCVKSIQGILTCSTVLYPWVLRPSWKVLRKIRTRELDKHFHIDLTHLFPALYKSNSNSFTPWIIPSCSLLSLQGMPWSFHFYTCRSSVYFFFWWPKWFHLRLHRRQPTTASACGSPQFGLFFTCCVCVWVVRLGLPRYVHT